MRPRLDPATDAGFRIGIESLREEQIDLALEYRGDPMPDWLQGTFLHNGPGLFEVGGQSFRHLFDGLAMVHAFALDRRGVRYTSRFLRSPAYRDAQRYGRICYSEFATVPRRGLLGRLRAQVAPLSQFGLNNAIHVVEKDGATLAIGDLPTPLQIDPHTIETLGEYRMEGAGPLIQTTPHPLRDPARSEWVNVGFGLGPFGLGYRIFRVPDGSRRRETIAFIPRSRPTYMHSFALTERHVVLTEHPFVPDLVGLLTMGLTSRPLVECFSWRPDGATTFIVVERTTGRRVAELTSEGFLTFHHANAFDQDGRIYVDIAAYASARILQDLYLDRLRGPEGGRTSRTEYRRYCLDPTAGRVTWERLGDEAVELPRINDGFAMRPHRYVYGTTIRRHAPPDFINQLGKLDVTTGEARAWYEPGCYPTEPVPVARPGVAAEDDGVVFSIVVDANTRSAFLLVLDAATFEEIGRARVPHPIPFGFHGNFRHEPAAV